MLGKKKKKKLTKRPAFRNSGFPGVCFTFLCPDVDVEYQR
eukprot:COSAG06_NODE_1742_length_8503_cov_6.223703_6_plen_40_part_00